MNKKTTFEINCEIYDFPSYMIDYETPGLSDYCKDVRNHVRYMHPIIMRGHQKHIENHRQKQLQKKIVTRDNCFYRNWNLPEKIEEVDDEDFEDVNSQSTTMSYYKKPVG